MVPELGTFAIILALGFAILQTFSNAPKRNAVSQLVFLMAAMCLLIVCFVTNDLTVVFVREHSHHQLPLMYKIGAAWGGHEGSLLLWCLILSGWTVMFLIFSRIENLKILKVLGFVSTGFLTFLLLTSNPFKRSFPTDTIVGNDLAPILQDPGLIFHPPMLYLGYVGFAIGFAYAISALWEGKASREWARSMRPWIIMPWSFLSCGIVLGSWWAYRELGWGGWWFWDPVENASLLPWLSATALIHSLIVTEKRDVFKGWTILLAIVTFALSLLGTFLVRSGVLVSVHAFASDPTRGVFLLAYLALLIGGALLLYGFRIKDFYQAPKFNLFSRETFLLLNSVIFLTVVITIILGTLYPIILDALNLEKISVGEPYFNSIFVPLMLPLVILMGFAPHVNWSQQTFQHLYKKTGLSLLVSLVLALLLPRLFGFELHVLSTLGIFAGLWIIFATLQYCYQLIKSKNPLLLSHLAMIVSHLGIAILVLGITLNKSFSEERQVKMLPGETISLAGYNFTFKTLNEAKGPNYESLVATFSVANQKQVISDVAAEQRIYVHKQSLSKTGILAKWWCDLYLALGGSLPDGSWSVRIYFKPFVRWIWFGGFMLLAGGGLALLAFVRKRGMKHEYT